MVLHPFFETIHRLRSQEEVLLFGRLSEIDRADEQDVADYLESEWANELLNYPGRAPAYDPEPALWAAHTLFTAAQLLLYRDQPATDLPAQLPAFPAASPQAGAMLSADLCLRFLPAMLTQFSAIDPDDPVIPHLRAILRTFHYSAVGYPLPEATPDFEAISASPCLLQLYADRVIDRKASLLAAHPALQSTVRAALGDHAGYFWKELTW